ncbi:hypothetical protein FACS1894199_05140 [Bacteroidia bacterium]|nr:hypothetical protein FACS1894199_05140 [Bacteroidia bacterium]
MSCTIKLQTFVEKVSVGIYLKFDDDDDAGAEKRNKRDFFTAGPDVGAF